MAEFEWDPAKETSNRLKHGVDFETASVIWDGPVIEKRDARRDYGEARVIALGMVERRILAVVYTWRHETRRIISARKATRRERQNYEEAIVKRTETATD
jgi:uncharacterized protein